MDEKHNRRYDVAFRLKMTITLFLWFLFLGAVFGALSAVAIYRLPKGQSLISGSSHCPKCGQRIGTLASQPILGYLLVRGRCRSCKKPISWAYPLTELFGIIIAVVIFLKVFFWTDPRLLPEVAALRSLWLIFYLQSLFIFCTMTRYGGRVCKGFLESLALIGIYGNFIFPFFCDMNSLQGFTANFTLQQRSAIIVGCTAFVSIITIVFMAYACLFAPVGCALEESFWPMVLIAIFYIGAPALLIGLCVWGVNRMVSSRWCKRRIALPPRRYLILQIRIANTILAVGSVVAIMMK